ncbi:MAG: hypothetical protein ABIG20_04215 [archaeon]
MKYHPGKVLQIYSPEDKNVKSADETEQALVEMWDENLITVSVETALQGKVKEGNVVLVDYTPTVPNSPVPRMTITKILKGKVAEKTWSEYKEFNKNRKSTATPSMPVQKNSYG